MTSEYFGPLTQDAFGVEGFNYDKFRQWLEGQPLNFKRSLSIQGDLLSSEWDGTTPLDLSTVDTGASAGFALDSSVGAAQFQKLFVRGTGATLTLDPLDFPKISWSPDDLSSDGYISVGVTNIGGGDIGTMIIHAPADFASNNATELVLFAAAAGDGGNRMVLLNASYFEATRTKVGNGSALSPVYTFQDNDTIGIYKDNPNSFAFGFSGSQMYRFGDVSTGVGFRSQAVRDITTGAAASVFINSSTGLFARSTSALKNKPGWMFVDESVLADLEMPTPITWEDKDGGTMLGFGADHVREMLDAATQDNYENYDVRSLVAILSAKVKRLERECLKGPRLLVNGK